MFCLTGKLEHNEQHRVGTYIECTTSRSTRDLLLGAVTLSKTAFCKCQLVRRRPLQVVECSERCPYRRRGAATRTSRGSAIGGGIRHGWNRNTLRHCHDREARLQVCGTYPYPLFIHRFSRFFKCSNSFKQHRRQLWALAGTSQPQADGTYELINASD